MATENEYGGDQADTRAAGPDLRRGEIFDLLSNHRRRYAILHCRRAEEAVSLSTLAENVAAWELDKTVPELASDERKRVYTSLQQRHLPTLDRAGLIEFENGTVTLTEQADQLNIYLDIVPSDTVPWGIYYLGLSAFGFVVLAGLWLDLVPTETVPAVGWMALVLALVGGSAIAHWYTSRKFTIDDIERPP